MCGIVGAASTRNIVPILIEGIRRLEYRGYDSSGLAVIGGGLKGHHPPTLDPLVSNARAADLAPHAAGGHLHGTTGHAHPRRAPHGAPAEAHAHPPTSHGEIAVVHNRIIENCEGLRDKLKEPGYVFSTPADTEVIAHLVDSHWHAPGGGDL